MFFFLEEQISQKQLEEILLNFLEAFSDIMGHYKTHLMIRNIMEIKKKKSGREEKGHFFKPIPRIHSGIYFFQIITEYTSAGTKNKEKIIMSIDCLGFEICT